MAVVNAEAELLAAAGPRPTARGAAAARRGAPASASAPAAAGCSRAPLVAALAAALRSLPAVGLAPGCSPWHRRGDALRQTRARRPTVAATRPRPAPGASSSSTRRPRAAAPSATCRRPPRGRVYQVWVQRGGPAAATDALFDAAPRHARRSHVPADPDAGAGARDRRARRRRLADSRQPTPARQRPRARRPSSPPSRERPLLRRSVASSAMATCYRHPNRETGVSCSSCGRPICPDCMTPTPVGMRCPECAQQKTPVRDAGARLAPADAPVDDRAHRGLRRRLPRRVAAGSARAQRRGNGASPTTARSSGPRSRRTASTGGWSPAASCTPGFSTSPSTCTCCGSSGGCSSRRSARRASSPCTSPRCCAARSARCCCPARRAHRRRLGRDLRPDGRRRRRPALARHQPVRRPTSAC